MTLTTPRLDVLCHPPGVSATALRDDLDCGGCRGCIAKEVSEARLIAETPWITCSDPDLSQPEGLAGGFSSGSSAMSFRQRSLRQSRLGIGCFGLVCWMLDTNLDGFQQLLIHYVTVVPILAHIQAYLGYTLRGGRTRLAHVVMSTIPISLHHAATCITKVLCRLE